MKAESPVLLKSAVPLPEMDLAEGTEYNALPVLISQDTTFMATARFHLTWRERWAVLFGGNIWLQQLTFGKAYPPAKLLTKEPSIYECL